MATDAEQLGALYDAHAAVLRRYVVHLTGDGSAADDVVQETLIRAWRSPKIMAEDPSTVRPWLFTVARHLVVDGMRSARHRHESAVADPPDTAVRDATDAVFDAILIGEAFASLSNAHREVVVLAYYGGRTVAEIADELGTPEGTVKSRLHYGLRALRLALQEKGVTR